MTRQKKYKEELRLFEETSFNDEEATAWKHLERAHILSQNSIWNHTYIHWLMLTYAIKCGLWREVLGQIPRILLAGIGSAFGKAPIGNPGTVRVGIFQPALPPADLLPYLGQSNIQ